ncbi:GNAT family N-acetyltransferase [Chryseobacterium arthrosphaerae]|uniref:GNAT family N-acetyltransferase n=1 Tax=Chryseobacterium arthrosphaerae TaxID=651561 RepID=UPI0023E3484C|nr:GNAT family N-acetyltransferase [Chryseobacterium arthrosphaerae]WET00151.1 GNAT family N-acetyltransferase [Chryseobacterium arthrosphaerae]
MKETGPLSFDLIKQEQIRLRSKTLRTNFFLSEEKFDFLANGKRTVAYSSDNGFYFLIEQDDFYKLFFITNDIGDLKNHLESINQEFRNMIIVSEIVGNHDYLKGIFSEFTDTGFYEYTKLVRMNKMRTDITHFKLPENIYQLKEDRLAELQNIYHKYFNKFAEQIPTQAELQKMIRQEDVYYYSDDSEIQGFIIFEKAGITSHLRYWFVSPDHRSKKIGSKLMEVFFTKFEDVKREIFWVIDTNENAIKRYKHFGFVEEKMYNVVLLNKKLKYEEQNN